MSKKKRSSKLTSMNETSNCKNESTQPKACNSLSSMKNEKSKYNGYSNCR